MSNRDRFKKYVNNELGSAEGEFYVKMKMLQVPSRANLRLIKESIKKLRSMQRTEEI